MAIIHYKLDPNKKFTPEEMAHFDQIANDLENWVDEPDEDCPPLTEDQLEEMRQIIRERKKHA